ncbi:DUF4352 domain-containing protein [Oryzobacter terrae]|uniref:DUF4352 domain-containing protein n=1 Tax=Oryzobacter terrae TaxID=1620385 RepID=UPI00366A9255
MTHARRTTADPAAPTGQRGRAVVHPATRVPTRTRVAALVGGLALVALTACSGSDSTDTAAPGASTSPSASPSASAPTETARPTPAPSSVGPTPTPGPSVVAKVKRPGAPATPTVSAAPAAFDKAVAYPDGLRLTVGKVTSGVESGQGLGAFAGREFAVFEVRLENRTSKALDLQAVVVTATYGAKNLVAERVYADDVDAKDFGGTLAAGKTAGARYAFAVPKASLNRTRLVVDFDGVHTSAEFRGDARAAG